MTSRAVQMDALAQAILKQDGAVILRQRMRDPRDLSELMAHSACARVRTVALCSEIARQAGGDSLGPKLKSFWRTIEKASMVVDTANDVYPKFDDAKDTARDAIQFQSAEVIVKAQDLFMDKHNQGVLNIL